MVTPEEMQNRLIDSEGFENDLEIIEKALNEAYNEAIKEAAKIPSQFVNKWNFTPADIEKEILKLLKK